MNEFQLTDTLIDEIITVLEDQNIQQKTINGYPLPPWDSAAGYELREEWCNTLYPSDTKKALKDALHSGRGAFHSFKETLKVYRGAQKLWDLYKKRKMRALIGVWYNELCAQWGLESLPIDDDEVFDAADLLKTDFDFSIVKGESIENGGSSPRLPIVINDPALKNGDEGGKDDASRAVMALWDALAALVSVETQFLCSADNDEVAGMLFVGKFSNECGARAITRLFVRDKWRGLGIASQLLAMCIDYYKHLCHNIIAPFASDDISRLLESNGFTKVYNCYILTLEDNEKNTGE